jgi:hypothetical protein
MEKRGGCGRWRNEEDTEAGMMRMKEREENSDATLMAQWLLHIKKPGKLVKHKYHMHC